MAGVFGVLAPEPRAAEAVGPASTVADTVAAEPRAPDTAGPAPEATDAVASAPGTSAATASASHEHALRGMFSRDFVYIAASALQVILATAVTPIITRRVTPSEYGQVALAVTVLQMLGPIFSFGLPFATQKVYAGEDGDRRARGVLAVATVLALVAWVIVALAAPAWGPAIGLYHVSDARLASLWGALFALTWSSLAFLRSKESLRMAIFIGFLQSVGAQAAGVALVYISSPTVTNYLIGGIIGQGAAGLAGLLALRPDWSALAAIRRYGRALAFGLPMVPQQLSVYILYAVDRIVISNDIGSSATGRYSVAYNVGCLGSLLLVFVNQAWLPRIYSVADRAARSRLLAMSRDMMNLLLVPVVCGLAAAAPLVLRIWAPPSFNPTELTPIVAIVAVSTFPFGWFLANVRGLMSESHTGRAAWTTLIGAVVNIVLNLLMVPVWGITGSAIATVLSYAVLAWLTKLPARSGLVAHGVPRRHGFVIAGGMAFTIVMGVIPTSEVWIGVRAVVVMTSVAAFLVLLRRAISGTGGLARRRAR